MKEIFLSKKIKQNKKGITLIALVVTIVVLLILAGVAIATLTGENGLLSKANEAKEETIIGQEKEQVEIAYVSVAVNKLGGDVTWVDLQEELEKTIPGQTDVTPNDDKTINVEFTDTLNNYNVNKGIVTRVEPIVYGKEEWYTYEDVEGGVKITGFSDYINSAIENLSSLEGTEYENLGNLPKSYNGKEVVSIGSYALSGSILSKVVIPNSVITLESGAFCNNQLTSVTIPNSVRTIGIATFYGNQLTSVTIPSSVENISREATFANNNLSSVTFLGVPNFIDIVNSGNIAIFENNPNLIENSIKIPSGTLEYFASSSLFVTSDKFCEN